MNCSIHKQTFGAMIVSLNKIFRHAFEGIYVDQPGISALKNLSYQSFNQRVVLVPNYKSVTDLFIMLYVLYVN